ncbi:unnamed protein product [Eruca vesicaria subsp. sativa]|uniref:C2H2-type domain-containing protein n=1 Tax=Eruca vesicaria subsp. sativa TaxID=29727 RepID=A0ABC8LPN2_ERUVS|nr:unnamed protein product [Eruca vesicaria subsp. sativa]
MASTEDHQEFEKPIFELHYTKFRSSRKMRNRFVESMNHYEEIFCYYGVKEIRKKSPLGTRTKRIKKRLIRCRECSKGFRYEKCLRNHSETMHSLKEKKKKKSECTRRDLLCFFRSGVQRGKRSKRVSRYKKRPPPLSVSASSSSFVNDGELVEVAECLIMLSTSGDALFPNLEMNKRECEDGEKLVGKLTNESLSNEATKEFLGFLGDKKVMKEDETGQLKLVGAGSFGGEVAVERVSLEDRPEMMLHNAIEERLDGQEAVFEVSCSGSKILLMNNEYRCTLCDMVFSTYQALGRHQTFHKMKNNSEKSKHEMQRRVPRS